MNNKDYKDLCTNFNHPDWDNYDRDAHILWCNEQWILFCFLYKKGFYKIAWEYLNQNNYENHYDKNDEAIHCNF